MQPAAPFWPLAVVFGAAIGSFANVVALRWFEGRGLQIRSRSRCPHCRRLLRWFELIPIVSYLIQAGRCRDCGQRLTSRYLLVEVGLAAVFASFALTSSSIGVALLLALSSTLLLIALLVDLEHLLLPDALTLSVLVLLGASLVLVHQPNLIGGPSPTGLAAWWSGSLIAGGVIGLLYAVTRGRGMGFGDVKLAAALGLSLGGGGTLLALGIAFVSGAAIGLGLLARGRATLKTAVPFGPFLILGWWVVIIWGHSIWAWYTAL